MAKRFTLFVSRCLVPKYDIKSGFNMIPPIKHPRDVIWNFDHVFHYTDNDKKLKLHYYLMKDYEENSCREI